jgi:serine/threonine protein kinase
MVLGKPYSYEVDWWALGVLTYEMIFGRSPFYERNRENTMSRIILASPDFGQNADKDVVDFIQKLLTRDPKKRMRFTELETHPFFNGMKMWDFLEKKYTPSFVPQIPDLASPKYFDEEFKAEAPFDSLASICLDDDKFAGFEFMNCIQA